MKIELYLIRHGESEANIAKFHTNIFMKDPHLTLKGVMQCIELRKSRPEVDVILTSELLRAIHTGLEIYPDRMMNIISQVNELGYGMDNMPRGEIQQKQELDKYNKRYKYRIRYHDKDNECETLFSYIRKHIVPGYKGKTDNLRIAIITHQGFIKRNVKKCKKMNNCEICKIELR